MIRINLLPHRELKRQARRRQFGILCAIVAAIGAGIVFAVGGVIQGQISVQNESNAFIKKENDKLESDIKEIAKLRDEIEGLKARQKPKAPLHGSLPRPAQKRECQRSAKARLRATRHSQNSDCDSCTPIEVASPRGQGK